jgi:sortase A
LSNARPWQTLNVYRILASAAGITSIVFGSAFVIQGLEQEQAQNQLAEARLDPTMPLGSPARKGAPKPGTKLARLRIPAIDVDEVVVEGVGEKQLAVGIGHYPSTPAIGNAGSVAIAGHRTGWGDPLLRLNELKPGDKVSLKTATAAITYIVKRKIVVDPEDTWVLDGNPASKASHQLTITTCTPAGTSLRRLIVWAELAT